MIKFRGGTGETVEDAVIILAAEDTLEGIRAEKRYISVKNIDWEMKGQQLIEIDGHYFDRLTIVVDNLQEKQFYFDISKFFAKH